MIVAFPGHIHLLFSSPGCDSVKPSQNLLRNFGRRQWKEPWWEIIFNLRQPFRSNFLTDPSKPVLFYYLCFVLSVILSWSVPCSLVVPCWERALLAPLYGMFSCVLSLSHTGLGVVLNCIDS